MLEFAGNGAFSSFFELFNWDYFDIKSKMQANETVRDLKLCDRKARKSLILQKGSKISGQKT